MTRSFNPDYGLSGNWAATANTSRLMVVRSRPGEPDSSGKLGDIRGRGINLAFAAVRKHQLDLELGHAVPLLLRVLRQKGRRRCIPGTATTEWPRLCFSKSATGHGGMML